MSPYATRTVPSPVRPLLVERVERDPNRVAGAELLVLDREHRLGQALEDVRTDLLALVADDSKIRAGSSLLTAARTCPIMLRPPIGCSTFIVLDFIRVPPPAARTMTVSCSVMPRAYGAAGPPPELERSKRNVAGACAPATPCPMNRAVHLHQTSTDRPPIPGARCLNVGA